VRAPAAGDTVDEMSLVYFISASRERGEHEYMEAGGELEYSSTYSASLYTGTRTKDKECIEGKTKSEV
tara:strand:- start:4777 stop:4980 length:204 start_codon:yes stop_codon:yes gene_type:complete